MTETRTEINTDLKTSTNQDSTPTVVHHFINGKVFEANTKDYYEHNNPATGNLVTKVAMADKSVVEAAVSNSLEAFHKWAKTSTVKRAKIFFKFNQLLNQNIDKLAHLVTLEHGKTTADAKGSVLRGIEVVEHCCGIANLTQGSFTNNISSNIDVYTLRKPLGVCAGVAPFNFPIMVPLWMAAPAIACGNTFVLKPSEKVPSTMMLVAELFKQAGLPDGVFNIVNGHKEAVDCLLEHKDVQSVSAVGSTNIAEYIYKTAVNNNKRSQTFGGAKNHCIIMPDCDLSEVSDVVSNAAFGSAGERCMALSVAIVVGDKAREDKFIECLKADANKIKIGGGFEPDSDFGPLITKEHLNKVLDYIETGVSEGANLSLDGRAYNIENKKYANGNFLGPCIFNNINTNMTVYQEEIFGPVLVVHRVADYNSALELINDHKYGNGTAIFTNDLNISRDFVNNVEAGMVGVNIPIPVPFVTHSFGGWKSSVFGDLDMHATESINFYTKPKSITVGLAKLDKASNKSGMNMPVHD